MSHDFWKTTNTLWHGTSTQFATAIRKSKMILPRQDTGKQVYTGELTSQHDRTYLTNVYAMQFANLTCEKVGGKPLLVLCSINNKQLLADSDFSTVCNTGEACLDAYGTCSVMGGVEAIRMYYPTKQDITAIMEHRLSDIKGGIWFLSHRKELEERQTTLLTISRRVDLN